jgi:predicted RNase H-like HicB family nuclease
MASYVAVIRKEPNTAYGVDAPDIPGCVSVGDTIEEAKANFSEALALHLSDGDDPNMRRPPRPLEEIDAEALEGAVETYLVDL